MTDNLEARARAYAERMGDRWDAMGPDAKDAARRAVAFDLGAEFYAAAPSATVGVNWAVLQIGATGSAYDPPNTYRAFTYERQPGNVIASNLGGATMAAASASAGDSIDRGLNLLKALQEAGFGVFQIAALQHPAAPSVSPAVAGDAGELSWPTDLGWPDKPFTVHDEPGEHDPCWLVMPGGESIALNHHAINGVDQARAHFIADACNARRLATAEQPGSAVQGEDREQEAAALGNILRRFSAELSLHERASLTIAVQVLSGATPPPAPAAEQGDEFLDIPPFLRRNATREEIAEWNAKHTQPEARGVEGMAAIGVLIRTQDNRITAAPIFIVQQKRTVWGVDTDYDCDGFEWLDDQGPVDSRKRARLERLHQSGGDTGKYRRLGFKHYWDFVTACFTEQGCKDYLARDGHNLREPRIYAAGSYRNEEWRAVREHLMALAAAPTQEPRGG